MESGKRLSLETCVPLVFDRLVFVTHDLSAWRLGAALVAVLLLVTGLVMEAD